MTSAETASEFSLIDRVAVHASVACAFITDPQGRVLIVKPGYRDGWLFVGGFVDPGESPHQACVREVKEEIGLDLPAGDLLVIDWVPKTDNLDLPLTFYLFDCGVIDDPDAIALQESELTEYRFLPAEQAVALLAGFNQPRVALAMEARSTGKTVYQPALG